MNEYAIAPSVPKHYLQNSTLILVAFATAFFPRILDSLGAPAPINFVHFATVPIATLIAIFTTRTRDQTQISISWSILGGLIILFWVMTVSAFINDAGVINAILSFLMLAEPFLILLAVVCTPLTGKSFKQVRNCILVFALINMLLAFVQWPLLKAGRLSTNGMGFVDAVQGVFYITGAGNYVSASVSICVGMYYFVSAKTAPIWLRCVVLGASAYQLLLSDSKQIIMAFGVAWLLLVLTRFNDVEQAVKYLIAIVLVGLVFVWCVQNVPAFNAFNSWARPELYGPNGQGTQAKLAGIRIILSYYESPLNWLFGLGPGHSIGRLGGWMIKDYQSLLAPLGVTSHPASEAVWDAVRTNWLNSSGGSTLFSPFFGWAGIWGDLGFLGLGAYFYLAYIVWQCLCPDDMSKFWLLTIFVIGFIFTQIEEPGYMLSMAILFGLRWHDHRERIRKSQS